MTWQNPHASKLSLLSEVLSLTTLQLLPWKQATLKSAMVPAILDIGLLYSLMVGMEHCRIGDQDVFWLAQSATAGHPIFPHGLTA